MRSEAAIATIATTTQASNENAPFALGPSNVSRASAWASPDHGASNQPSGPKIASVAALAAQAAAGSVAVKPARRHPVRHGCRTARATATAAVASAADAASRPAGPRVVDRSANAAPIGVAAAMVAVTTPRPGLDRVVAIAGAPAKLTTASAGRIV